MSFLAAYTQSLHMTTAAWMLLPAQSLTVWSLTPTQDVDILWPVRQHTDRACADPCIHVVRLGAVNYVEDGHHRLARARRDHLDVIDGRVLVWVVHHSPTDTDDHEPWNAKNPPTATFGTGPDCCSER